MQLYKLAMSIVYHRKMLYAEISTVTKFLINFLQPVEGLISCKQVWLVVHGTSDKKPSNLSGWGDTMKEWILASNIKY